MSKPEGEPSRFEPLCKLSSAQQELASVVGSRISRDFEGFTHRVNERFLEYIGDPNVTSVGRYSDVLTKPENGSVLQDCYVDACLSVIGEYVEEVSSPAG